MTQDHNAIAAHSRFQALVRALRAQLHNRVIVSPGEALSALPGHHAEDLENAAYQRIRAGTFPFPVGRIGRKPVVLVTDIAEALLTDLDAEGAGDPDHEPDAAAKPKRGRPRLTAGAGGAA